jgi:hypothetical protein
MKKLTGLNEKMETITAEEDNAKMLTRRAVLQLMGNQKAENADAARRVRRIITKLRDKTADETAFENEDLKFMEAIFEKNEIGLPSWMQGQILDYLASAERVEIQPSVA